MFWLLAERVKVGAYTVRLRVVLAVREPEVPVMVRPTFAAGAELLAVRVSTLDPLVGLVLHDAVTPVGSADVTARLTLPLNPYWGVTVTFVVPDAPWLIERTPGASESMKLGGWTLTVTLVDTVILPDVPVMVIVTDAAGAEPVAVKVRTLVPLVGLVPHDAVTPVGSVELTARLTLPVNPPASVTVMVVELEAPWGTDTLLEELASQKPATCGPARASMRFCPFALPHPVTRS